jgi:hypothetical protein
LQVAAKWRPRLAANHSTLDPWKHSNRL